MKLEDAQALGLTLMRENGLGGTGWRLGFDKAARRIGACHYQEKRITLSVHYTREHDPEAVRMTMLHEIAHALCGKDHNHDEVWRGTCIRIGGDGERCGSGDFTPDQRYVAVCPDHGQIASYRNRPKDVGRYICNKGGTCGKSLKWYDTKGAQQ